MVSRAVHVFGLLGICNHFTASSVSLPYQTVIWFGGLRGAIAVALSCTVGGPNAHLVRAVTMLVVVFTTFAFGGSTKCLLDKLRVPMGCADELEGADGVAIDEDRGVRPLVPAAQHHGSTN